MPEYRCKKCKAVFYSWGVGKVCLKCRGELEPAPEYTVTKK